MAIEIISAKRLSGADGALGGYYFTVQDVGTEYVFELKFNDWPTKFELRTAFQQAKALSTSNPIDPNAAIKAVLQQVFGDIDPNMTGYNKAVADRLKSVMAS